MLGVLGDVYLTNALVKKHGTEIEANPRVKRMYETGGFWKSWAVIAVCLGFYVVFAFEGQLPIPYAPFTAAGGGAVISLFPTLNLLQGASVFLRLRAP